MIHKCAYSGFLSSIPSRIVKNIQEVLRAVEANDGHSHVWKLIYITDGKVERQTCHSIVIFGVRWDDDSRSGLFR